MCAAAAHPLNAMKLIPPERREVIFARFSGPAREAGPRGLQRGERDRIRVHEPELRLGVPDAHVFASRSDVLEINHGCVTACNDERPHEALGNASPSIFSQQKAPAKTEPMPAPVSTYDLFP